MNLKNEFQKFNIDTFGVCDAKEYNRIMGTDYERCIVALFPYFCGYEEDSNLSIYTHGEDYHIVIRDILNSVARSLGIKNFSVHADTGPEIDRLLALKAGLCFRGRNSMCINDKYGSYFFIGYIVCDAPLPLDKPFLRECNMCLKCVTSCPGGALKDGFCIEKCLSHITQKKGELTENELEKLKKHPLVFGCDICQKVCPHNEDICHTNIERFKENTITSLSLEDIEGISNTQFKEKYKDRAFAWRGKNVILRNLKYQGEQKNEDINT